MATTANAAATNAAKRIDINTAPPELLSQMRQNVMGELEYVRESAEALRKAMSLFEQARVAAEKISECTPGQKSLVPITNSLFMKGELIEPQKIVVDIGTGYYVEMSAKRAVDFYKRKVDFVRGQLNTLRQIIDEKSHTANVLTEVLQKKIQALTAGAAPQKSPEID